MIERLPKVQTLAVNHMRKNQDQPRKESEKRREKNKRSPRTFCPCKGLEKKAVELCSEGKS